MIHKDHNWEFNDCYTQGLIINNVTQGVKHHISTCKSVKEMWSSLATIFESKAHPMLRAYKRNLESLKADEDTDIIKNLDQLKIYWEHINSSPNKDHHISDFNFKLTINDSLPASLRILTSTLLPKIPSLNTLTINN